jgi:hypothetical protein
VQSSGKGLALPQTVALTEGFGNAFRTKGGTCASRTIASDTCYSQVANDIATVATSLTFSVTGIPSGVTVKFPSSMSTSAVDGADALAFGARSTTLDNGAAAGNLTVTYDTSANTAALLNVMTVETADNPDLGTNIGTTTATSNPNCKISGTPAVLGNLNAGSNCNANPKVGVKVASISGAGTANYRLRGLSRSLRGIVGRVHLRAGIQRRLELRVTARETINDLGSIHGQRRAHQGGKKRSHNHRAHQFAFHRSSNPSPGAVLRAAGGSRPGPHPDPYNRETRPRTAGDHTGHSCNCRRHAKTKLLI